MSNDARLDDELAAYTDGLLAGEEQPVSGEMAELAGVVRQLRETIAPHEKPAPAFRARLTQRLDREWTLHHERQTESRWWWRNRRALQLTAIAATITVVLFVVALISAQGNDGNDGLEGTALSPVTGLVGLILLMAGIGVAMIWLRRHRDP
jgi:anti-sigma factor RsiW